MPDVKHISVGGVTYDIPTGGAQIMTATVKYDSTTKIPENFTIDTLLDLNVGDLVVINPDTTNDVYAMKVDYTTADTNEYWFESDGQSYILPAVFTVVETYTQYNRKHKVLRYLATGNIPESSNIKPFLSDIDDSTGTIEDVVLTLLLRYKYAYTLYSDDDGSINCNLQPYDSSGDSVVPDGSACFIHDSYAYSIYKFNTAPTNISYFSYGGESDVTLPLLFNRVGHGDGSSWGSWPMIVGNPRTKYTVSDPSILNNNKIIMVKCLIGEANSHI